jgi:hypothetical protein
MSCVRTPLGEHFFSYFFVKVEETGCFVFFDKLTKLFEAILLIESDVVALRSRLLAKLWALECSRATG